jgi:pimeloyl-ACP methyl ester carboxylesterase
MDREPAAEPEPELVVVEHDGLRIASLDWGGPGRPLLLMHPNGFCAGMWGPLAGRLGADYRCVAVDVRGHGGSDAPAADGDFSFRAAAGDIVPVLDALGLDEVVALGHSLGGACVILLDELRPGLVTRALLCEAIAFPAGSRRDGPNPLATAARRRRAVWPDRATVLESYASRPPLNVMERDVLAAYVRWGFRDRPDGRVELACAPESEAAFFDAGMRTGSAQAAFEHLPEFAGRATVVMGDRTDIPHAVFGAQADAVGAPLVALPGDHFFLQEDTARAADLVRTHL